MTENQAVDIYINLLLGEITESVRENIDPKEMKKIKHMLVVKSAKQGPFLDTIKILMDFNLDIKISVLGEETDRDILKEAGISVEKLFVRQGRLDENKVDEYIDNMFLADIDGVCFINSKLHSDSYINVEKVCFRFAEKAKCKIYSFTVKDHIWNLYYDIEKHIKALEAYCSVVNWLDYYIQ